MTDTPPRPKRTRWRWLAVGLLLFIIALLIWNWRTNQRLVQRVRQVTVGQTKAEVKAILGPPQLTSFRGQAGSYCYGFSASKVRVVTVLAYKYLRIGKPLPLSAFPIEVTFGDDGRVTSIRHPDKE